jgi:four helix bundle protein
MKDFHNLDVWTRSHRLTLALYRATLVFPRNEMYGLTAQVRRAAASIPANIAEGCGRTGNGELHRFLDMASGSASELDYHLLLARDLGYLAPDAFTSLMQELTQIRRMLTALIQKVRADRAARVAVI